MKKIVHRVGQLANSIWAVGYSIVDAGKQVMICIFYFSMNILIVLII